MRPPKRPNTDLMTGGLHPRLVLEGLLFGWRYQETRSLPAVGFEHALGGNFLSAVGIGWFFYHGSIRSPSGRRSN